MCDVRCVMCDVRCVMCGELSVESGVRSNIGKCLAQALLYKVVPEVPCARFVVQSTVVYIGNYSVQDLQYKVVL